jgi:hypothetical protein
MCSSSFIAAPTTASIHSGATRMEAGRVHTQLGEAKTLACKEKSLPLLKWPGVTL